MKYVIGQCQRLFLLGWIVVAISGCGAYGDVSYIPGVDQPPPPFPPEPSARVDVTTMAPEVEPPSPYPNGILAVGPGATGL